MGSCLRTLRKSEPENFQKRDNAEPKHFQKQNQNPELEYGGKRRSNSLLSNYR